MVTAAQAIDFYLHAYEGDDPFKFFEDFRDGDLDEHPDFLAWLAEQVSA